MVHLLIAPYLSWVNAVPIDIMNQQVTIKVVEIRGSGWVVEIQGTNQLGFIRRRELSWDRSVTAYHTLSIGDALQAKVIPGAKNFPYLQLSVRQLTDPWEDIRRKYKEGQIVRGEVVNIRSFGVFAQLEPGIDAVIWPRDIPFLPSQRLENVLAVGDAVQGVITDIDYSKHRIQLSIIHRIKQVYDLLRVANYYPIPQIELFKDRIGADSSSTKVNRSSLSVTPPTKTHYHPPIGIPNKILVVDDNQKELDQLSHYLQTRFNIPVKGIADGETAYAEITQDPLFTLAIIDLNLKGESGIQIAQKLLTINPQLSIIFISNDPMGEKSVSKVYGHMFPFCIKENSQVAEWIDELCSGYWESDLKSYESAYVGKGNFISQLGMKHLPQRSFVETVWETVLRLRKETQVTHVIVLEVDSANKKVSFLATAPLIRSDIQQYVLDGLYFSPVRNVVENEEIFYKTNISSERDSDLKYFFPLLSFQSCLGIPLVMPHFVTRYALFLLDEKRSSFETEIQQQAEASAHLILIALERDRLLDYMRRYEQRYLLGQLLGSLVHELMNKLDTFGSQVEVLPVVLDKARNNPEGERQRWWEKSGQIVAKLNETKQELEELVLSYSRVAKGDLEAVNVAAVLEKIKNQLDTRARDANIQIIINEAPSFPMTKAILPRLEQVVANLVLNAIQQIENQCHLMAQISHAPLVRGGIVMIQTRYRGTDVSRPIEIIVIDTGPGIHMHRQGEIFMLDTSLRPGGHGLGLFISRNLVETMGGELLLADSVMFLGSAFVVRLPAFQGESTR